MVDLINRVVDILLNVSQNRESSDKAIGGDIFKKNKKYGMKRYITIKYAIVPAMLINRVKP